MAGGPLPPGYAPFPAGGAPPPIGIAPPAYGAYPVGHTIYRPTHENDLEGGGGATDSFGRSFSDKNLRRGFVRKVYSILSVQLLVSFAIVALFVFSMDVKMWARRNLWAYYLSFGVFIVTMLTISCCEGPRRKFPLNFILLSLLTLAMSYMASMLAAVNSPSIVLMAVGMTAFACIGITLAATMCPFDMTKYAMYLFVAGWVLFAFGITITIVTLCFGRGSPNGYINPIWTIYSAIACLLFMAYLAFDTQLIMGGKKHELGADEYILGALILYVDIMYIFIYILSLLGLASR